MSHPSWVRGLKFELRYSILAYIQCRTPRGCVDWNPLAVTIEPYFAMSHPSWVRGLKWKRKQATKKYKVKSHPSWVRGLKFNELTKKRRWDTVAPLVGAWIEMTITHYAKLCIASRTPRGCVDWNGKDRIATSNGSKSHPSWVRGLKYQKTNFLSCSYACRTPRGCVDWNIKIKILLHIINRSHPSWVRGLKSNFTWSNDGNK